MQRVEQVVALLATMAAMFMNCMYANMNVYICVYMYMQIYPSQCLNKKMPLQKTMQNKTQTRIYMSLQSSDVKKRQLW